jgi:5-methylcytosine-specific restriction endonuclease McrA
MKERAEFRCASCGLGEPGIRLEPDHIIPLARGGSTRINNIQPLCASCNRRKGTRLIPAGEMVR